MTVRTNADATALTKVVGERKQAIAEIGFCGWTKTSDRLAFCQSRHFGFIKMPGSFLVNAYPVILQWQDVLATIAGVALIGYIIALLPVRRNIR